MQILKKSIMTLALAGVALASQAATVEVQFANPIFGALGHDDLTIAFTVPGNPSTIKTETVSAGRFQGLQRLRVMVTNDGYCLYWQCFY